MEVLDLYDKNFNKLNKTIIRRVDEIPEDTYIMLSYALIKNNDKYLLEQSNKKDDYKYTLPGGHLQTGDNALEGLKRELEEELGITNYNPKLLETFIYPYKNYIFNIYLIEDNIDLTKIKMQEEEVIGVNFYSKEEILSLINEDKIPKGYKYIIERFI